MLLLVRNYRYIKNRRCFISSTDEYFLESERIMKKGRVKRNPELLEILEKEKRDAT
jgi:hypothetical protein